MPSFLQQTQVEAHTNRLTNIRTQLTNYAESDGRAATAIPQIDALISTLNAEPYAPDNEIVAAEATDEATESTEGAADAEGATDEATVGS